MRTRDLISFLLPLMGMFTALVAAGAGGFDEISSKVTMDAQCTQSGEYFVQFDVVDQQRLRFAAEHGVLAPAALVAAVKHSAMADLLISVAIEESLGNPVAVGLAGEKGAWQVKASFWGTAPEDLYGQAGQAEKIINGLLMRANGDKKKALARYNGGSSAPCKSYRYAERILKRAELLQFAVTFLPPRGTIPWKI